MAQKQQSPQEEPRRNKTFREFHGVNTQSARVSIPENTWYDLDNMMPIGPANLHTIPNISGVLHDYAADPIYWMQFATLQYVDYMYLFSTTGKVFQYNIVTQVSTQINVGTPLSAETPAPVSTAISSAPHKMSAARLMSCSSGSCSMG